MSQQHLYHPHPHPQPFNGVQNGLQNPQNQENSAYYVFNEKLVAFADTINYLAKYSDLLLVEFGERMLYIEAITPTKSAYACATFQGNSIADWTYGDLEDILDKRIQLSAKQLVGALRNVTKHDTMQFFITGVSCEKVIIEYTNNRGIMRTYDLQAREMSLLYRKTNYNRNLYANRIVCSTQFFKVLFTQLCDNDEMCLQFFADHSVITKYVTEAQEATSSTLHSMQNGDTYDTYEITVPMSMTISVRELKMSLKLISVHSYMACIFFDVGGKPLLITYEDDEKDEKCKILLSIAEVREITEDEEERPGSVATQSGIANESRRPSQSHSGFTQESRQQRHRQEDEESEAASDDQPPLKQRRKSKPFSFEDDEEEEDENQIRHHTSYNFPRSSASSSIQNDVPPENRSSNGSSSSGNRDEYIPQNNPFGNDDSSFNNGNFAQHDFDDVQEPAVSPSEIPQRAKNSISPTCMGLRLLGIEDQISDPEAEDDCELFDLPATDPSDDLFNILSQAPPYGG